MSITEDDNAGLGFGVKGTSNSGQGVVGETDTGTGVAGTSNGGPGVSGRSKSFSGVNGEASENSTLHAGVRGVSTGAGYGVMGVTLTGAAGVGGLSDSHDGVFGETGGKDSSAVHGRHLGTPGSYKSGLEVILSPPTSAAVLGETGLGVAVLGKSQGSDKLLDDRESIGVTAVGVWGSNTGEGVGVVGFSTRGTGVAAWSNEGHFPAMSALKASREGVAVDARGGETAVYAAGGERGVDADGHETGVRAIGRTGVVATGITGVYAGGVTTGVFAHAEHPGFAGNFVGRVTVTGPVHKSGGGFTIDHPQDPANRYLNHAFVESSEMKNVYDGIAVLDARGGAVIRLPSWFEALNREFRYQLTPIGGPAPNLHVAEEISRNRFRIAGGTKGLKVAWQVTGIRQDAWAKANPVQVEERKPRKERGYYRHPELYDQPKEKSVEWARNPELMELAEKEPERRRPLSILGRRDGLPGGPSRDAKR